MVNGIWTEQQYSEAKRQIVEASRADIEKVSLNIWSNFLKNL
jgi:hypothetical protein